MFTVDPNILSKSKEHNYCGIQNLKEFSWRKNVQMPNFQQSLNKNNEFHMIMNKRVSSRKHWNLIHMYVNIDSRTPVRMSANHIRTNPPCRIANTRSHKFYETQAVTTNERKLSISFVQHIRASALTAVRKAKLTTQMSYYQWDITSENV